MPLGWLKEFNPRIDIFSAVAGSWLGFGDAGEGGAQVFAENVFGAWLADTFGLAPPAPGSVQFIDFTGEPQANVASFLDERVDGGAERFEFLDGLAGAFGLNEMTTLVKPGEAI